ncbi:MAG: ATP-binding protein [Spirochaetes bacterium]|nr:ATP-binding protein [Spirochaetota bacterium]
MNKITHYLSNYENLRFQYILSDYHKNGIMKKSEESEFIHKKNVGNLLKNFNGELADPDGTIFCNLAVSNATDLRIHDEKYFRLELSSENRDNLFRESEELNKKLVTRKPEMFKTMEHFFDFIPNISGINVMRLTDIYLSSVMDTVKKTLNQTAPLETFHFVEDKDRFQFHQRIEIKKDVFVYVDYYTYDLYYIDDILFVVGIEIESNLKGSENILKIYCEKSHIDYIMKIFNKEFEKKLIENLDIKGGKFNGEGKLLDNAKHIGLQDIFLEAKTRKDVDKEIFNFFKLQPLYEKVGIPFKRGVAIYGPPGTGKTMLAKIIISNFSETAFWVKAGDITKPEDISRIFNMARIGAPSVIIFEDIDFYIEDREKATFTRNHVATIMSELDGVEENNGILVIVTTNRIESIEKAIIERPGRIDTKIFFGELGHELICEFLEKQLSALPKEFGSFAEVIPHTTIMTGALVKEFATLIVRFSIANNDDQIKITADGFKKAFREIIRIQNKQQKVGFNSDI